MAETKVKRSEQDMVDGIVGIESEATVHTMRSDRENEEARRAEAAARFNQDVGDIQERVQKHLDAMRAASEALAKDMNHVEIMPLGCYALIQPFDVNPFQKVERSESGILLLNGLTPTYKSEEDGQVREETPYVKVGLVAETGPDCRFLEPGDIVFYNVASEVQVPYFRFGFVIVNEQRVLSVVGEGLTDRRDALRAQNGGKNG